MNFGEKFFSATCLVCILQTGLYFVIDSHISKSTSFFDFKLGSVVGINKRMHLKIKNIRPPASTCILQTEQQVVCKIHAGAGGRNFFATKFFLLLRTITSPNLKTVAAVDPKIQLTTVIYRPVCKIHPGQVAENFFPPIIIFS